MERGVNLEDLVRTGKGEGFQVGFVRVLTAKSRGPLGKRWGDRIQSQQFRLMGTWVYEPGVQL